jgi:hypothetical protein
MHRHGFMEDIHCVGLEYSSGLAIEALSCVVSAEWDSAHFRAEGT